VLAALAAASHVCVLYVIRQRAKKKSIASSTEGPTAFLTATGKDSCGSCVLPCICVGALDDVPQGAPAFRFGAIGDVQYADADDAWDFDHVRKRFYRGSLNSVRAAVAAWNSDAPGPQSPQPTCLHPSLSPLFGWFLWDLGCPPVNFAVQLGDVIDGRCARGGIAESTAALETVYNEFRRFRGTVFDVIGNHEVRLHPAIQHSVMMQGITSRALLL
jgi:hypothetical protein